MPGPGSAHRFLLLPFCLSALTAFAAGTPSTLADREPTDQEREYLRDHALDLADSLLTRIENDDINSRLEAESALQARLYNERGNSDSPGYDLTTLDDLHAKFFLRYNDDFARLNHALSLKYVDSFAKAEQTSPLAHPWATPFADEVQLNALLNWNVLGRQGLGHFPPEQITYRPYLAEARRALAELRALEPAPAKCESFFVRIGRKTKTLLGYFKR